MTRSLQRRLCVALLIAAHVLLSVLSMRHHSPMTDEGGHYSYGRRILEANSAFEDTPWGVGKMPFSAFNALPWALAERLDLATPLTRLATRNRSPAPPSITVPPEQVFPVLTGRLATVFFSVLLALVVFRWSSELFGFAGGLVSLFVYAFCPTLLAYSHLVMLDLYAALMVTVASYFFWLYLKRHGWRWAALSALMLGLAQLAKYACLYLYPVFALVGLIHSWPRWVECARSGDARLWRHHLLRTALVIGLFALFLVVVINAGYLGQGSFTSLSEYSFQSASFQSLQKKILEIADVPVPLPRTPVIGLDALHHYEREGLYIPNLYLLGELRISRRPDLEGFKSYYLISWLFKVPIATQILLLVALYTHLSRKGREYLTTKELALFAPLVFFVLYFSLLYKAQIGIRHFLVVFPLVFVLCGAAGRLWERKNVTVRLSAAALGLYLLASVLSYYPHFLPYFNELVWDRKQAYKIVADSSIDMHGNQWFVEEYLAAHPETPFNPRFIDGPGTIVINVNLLTGVVVAPTWAWLRENFEPVDHVAHSYLVYEIGPEDMHLVPRRPIPSTLRQMSGWIAANLPRGVTVLREDGTPSLDGASYPNEHRPLLGGVSREFLTSGRWDFVLTAGTAHQRYLPPQRPSEAAPDETRDRIAQRYQEIFSWPLVAEFVPVERQRGSRIALYRVAPSEAHYRTQRRWKADAASWVSDEAILPAKPGDPLTFTQRWQSALFKGRFEPGLYEVRLLTEPPRPEAYLEVVTLDNRVQGPLPVGRTVVVELTDRAKYLFRVHVQPGARLSDVVIRPAEPGAVATESVARGAG